MKTKLVDFYVRNDFSIILLMPESQEAHWWVEENLCLEDWQKSEYIAIEPRMFQDIYEALINEGFILKAA